MIGAVELETASTSSSHIVYYAEAGTGHIYSLDINTGAETRISNITIPTAREAQITNNGKYAAVTSGSGAEGYTLTFLTLPQDGQQLGSGELNEKVKDFSLRADGQLNYTTLTSDTLTARRYNNETKTTATLFGLPFKEATVRFAQNSIAYVYPKPAETLEGYLYEVNGGKLDRLPFSGYALNVSADSNAILYSTLRNGIYNSAVYNKTNRKATSVAFGVISEKCTYIETAEKFFCGIDPTTTSNTLIRWYQGAVMSSDDLWLVDVYTGESSLLVSPQEEVGRPLDVTKPIVSDDATRFYFINKNDGALWVFDKNLSQN